MSSESLKAAIQVALIANNEATQTLKNAKKVKDIDNRKGRSLRVANGSIDRKN